jgi:membrane associated rhomboid family serine protease
MSGSGLEPQPPPPIAPPPCYRHPEKAASVLCGHCNRPICTDCMHAAPVGWQCPECTSEGAKRSRLVPAFTHTSRNRTGVVGATNPTPIVLGIIAINVVVFFLEGFGTKESFVDRYVLWPYGVHVLHQYYRAFTAMWLHASFTHIFYNMITLLIVGPALEVLLGKARFLTLYVLAGLGGSVCTYILGPYNEGGLGASGAIMGVLAAYIVVGLRRRLPVAPVVILLVINFALGFTGNTDWRAHLGGVIVGSLLALVYEYAGELRDQKTALVLTVGGSVAMLAVLALLITSVAPGHFNLN